ncbi:S41 family peptidase [Desulfovibrio oxyclinae]|jgi:carboxyl-terminal processing protease|uniref:S41 family peptidase n=1 Tax=Desulfovibrio oxyclinae TaxID=63560 RepID=UPI00036F17A0|nr:S41 family peptidase [Desulfovibrio oxyclinae]
MRITLWLATALLLFALAVSPGPSVAGKDPDRFQVLSRFSQVLELVGEQYVNPISREELIDDALKGMLEQLDPHSNYLTPAEFSGMQESTSGEFSGIGIEISMENNRLTVVTPIEDTPAYEAGLKAGDVILEIDGTPTYDMTLNDAVKLIRGEKGTTVTLNILHEGAEASEDIDIVRGTVPIVSVKTHSLGDGYMLVRLTRFNENTTRVLREGIRDFQKDGSELKGVVLDLRNNPGGVLGQAVSVADTFIEDGLLVYVQGRDENNRQDYFATRKSDDVTVPLVTVINSGSASAAEIVAGALQDHDRSLLIGERSFGKGSVQSLYPLPGGAGIKLTTALYYTPSGRSIQATGIEPDLTIPFIQPTEKDDDRPHRFFREKDLSGHLENVNGDKVHKKAVSEKVAEMLRRDNQLRMALELVKKLPKLRSIK